MNYLFRKKILVSILAAALLAGCGQVEPNVTRQNSVTISNSSVFPIAESSANVYHLLVSNNTQGEIRLVNQAINYSSEDLPIASVLDSSSCQTLAPSAKCLLTLNLNLSPTKIGSLGFTLVYSGTNQGQTYEVNRVISYSDNFANRDGMIYLKENREPIIENAQTHTLAYPFILTEDYESVSVMLNGQSSADFQVTNCSNGFKANSSCTALFEFNKDEEAIINIRALTTKGEERNITSRTSYTFGNYGYLTYSASPVIYPADKKDKTEVVVTNIGTADATVTADLVIPNGHVDTTIETETTCKKGTRLNPGKTCSIVYGSPENVSPIGNSFEHAMTYTGGLAGATPTVDRFQVYRTPAEFLMVDGYEIQTYLDGTTDEAKKIKFKLKYYGKPLTSDIKVAITGTTTAEFGYTSVNLTGNSGSNNNCNFTSANPTCEMTATLSGGTFPTSATSSIAKIQLSADNAKKSPSVVDHVFYKAAAAASVDVVELPADGDTLRNVFWRTWQDMLSAAKDYYQTSGFEEPTLKAEKTRFVPSANGCSIVDNLTGLEWLKNANAYGLKNWSDAKSAAANTNCDNQADRPWHLPTITELRTLINYDYAKPCEYLSSTKVGFSSVQCDWYSSSTPSSSDGAWFVHLNDGFVGGYNGFIGHGLYVWPVRCAQ